MKKVILEQDLVIPKGTEFDSIPNGTKTTWENGNYEAIIGMSKDSTAYLIINDDIIEDNKEKFQAFTDNNAEDL